MSGIEVCISGTSMMSACGIGNEEVWNAVLTGSIKQSERQYIMGDGSLYNYPVYAMPDLSLADWINSSELEWFAEKGLNEDIDFSYLCIAAKLALANADLPDLSNLQVALVVGHENLGVNHLVDKILQAPPGIDPLYNHMNSFKSYRNDFFMLQTFPHLFYLSKLLNITGPAYTVNNACASGLYALELGSQLIRSNKADIAVVVCADYAHITEYLWLEEKGFSSVGGQLRPFCKGRDGSILGDGAAAVILESPQSANRRNVKPTFSYIGGSLHQDNWQLILPDVSRHTYSQVINEAINSLALTDIDLLIPHGAGIRLWDQYEAREIKKAFEEDPPDVTSFKGYTGHTLGANSLLESVLLLECMRHNVIPHTANLNEIDTGIRLPIVQKTKEKRLQRTIKAVSAYGGFNAAAVFEKLN